VFAIVFLSDENAQYLQSHSRGSHGPVDVARIKQFDLSATNAWDHSTLGFLLKLFCTGGDLFLFLLSAIRNFGNFTADRLLKHYTSMPRTHKLKYCNEKCTTQIGGHRRRERANYSRTTP